MEIGVSSTELIPPVIIDEFILTIEKAGIEVEKESRDNDVFAGLEWMLPTAAIVFIANKYFGTLVSEMAKDHYAIIKSSLKLLTQRLSGPEREIELKYYASAPEKVSSDRAPVLSIYSTSPSGRPLKFVVENLSSSEQASLCVDAFFESMIRINEKEPRSDELGKPSGGKKEVIHRYDESKSNWYQAYPD